MTPPVSDRRPIPPSSISVQRYFEVSLLLTLTTAFVTLAATRKLDSVSVLVLALALGAKLWSYARDADWLLSPRAVNRLAVAYIAVYLLEVFVFSSGSGFVDRMLTATIHLVLFTTVVKVFSARTYRDYAYLAALSFLMMLAGAILTVSTNYLAGLALYVLFATSTFISYEVKRSGEAARQPSASAARPRRGVATTGVKLGVRTRRGAFERALALTTLSLALGIAVMATVLFFVIPRYRTGYLSGLGMEPQNLTGFSDQVNLGDIGRVKRSSVVVMRVMVEGNPRQFEGIKWRGLGLTHFDGRHWYTGSVAIFQLSPVAPEHFAIPPAEGWQRRPQRLLRYRVFLSPVATDVLFAAATPRELTGPLRFVAVDQTGSLHGFRPAMPLNYEVVSATGLPAPADLRGASTDYPREVRELYLELPQLDPRIAALARSITAHAADNYDRALALENYLRHNFTYTLDPAGIRAEDPVPSFLFESKQGYCEYFAAAMALMLRTLEIPSRLVNGFQTGTYNRVGGDFVVRARDAHTWVEAYFPAYGWIPFDPTPADPNALSSEGLFDDYLDALSLFWNEWVINYDFAHQAQLAGQLERDSRSWHHTMSSRFDRLTSEGARFAAGVESRLVSHKLLVFVITLTFMTALMFLEGSLSLDELRFLWRWRFQARSDAAGHQDATLAYGQFLAVVRRKGFRKSASETPQAFARRLTGLPWAADAQEFTRLYNALRFGNATLPLGDLRRTLETISAGGQ